MLQGIRWGTYVLFGVLTSLGAAFIYFFVPETKRRTLEEMDAVFGSEGTAAADVERMREINEEIGLTAMLAVAGQTEAENEKLGGSDQKA